MHDGPLQVLQSSGRPAAAPQARAKLIVAGATGALGSEVLHRLVGAQRFSSATVLAKERLLSGLRGVHVHLVPDGQPIETWPIAPAEVAVVMFDPPRMFYQRERALWTPAPEQLPALAQWLRGCGVRTLAVVMPHAQGRLPEALKRGLANIDEHAVAAAGFERVLIVRSAQRPANVTHGNPLSALAHWMLGIFKYMIPSSEQPVRAVKVSQFVDAALSLAPPGIHVAAPEVLWRASQGNVRDAVREWLAA